MNTDIKTFDIDKLDFLGKEFKYDGYNYPAIQILNTLGKKNILVQRWYCKNIFDELNNTYKSNTQIKVSAVRRIIMLLHFIKEIHNNLDVRDFNTGFYVDIQKNGYAVISMYGANLTIKVYSSIKNNRVEIREVRNQHNVYKEMLEAVRAIEESKSILENLPEILTKAEESYKESVKNYKKKDDKKVLESV